MARGCRDDLPDEQNGIFFARGLDSQSAAQFVDLPVGQISLCADTVQRPHRIDAVCGETDLS
jgi:hypothetical protein